MKNNKNSYYITLDDIRARSTPGAVKALEGSSGGKMPNTTEYVHIIYTLVVESCPVKIRPLFKNPGNLKPGKNKLYL